MDGVGGVLGQASQWYEANKEWIAWVFSGVGVAAIGALWALVRWLHSGRRRKGLESPAPDLAARNRQRMLEKVRYDWVEGVLEQSLYQVARMELGLTDQPKAVEHPWTLVAQHPERAPRTLPAGMPMVEVFDQFDQTLLLLGAPGSGKTTLLLELARDLIERAKGDPTHPIPVVFNLSSWAVRRPALADWLIDELSQRYDVPKKVAKEWIEGDQVLPLLDGLDEVAEEHRAACVDAINGYRGEHGLLPLVVTSRSAEYKGLAKRKRLRVPGAVSIEPLSREQVEAYLERAGTVLSGVGAAVRQDDTLWELLDTPLMLSILALAYRGSAAIRITELKGSLEERRAALFDAYIEAMFKPPPGRARTVSLLYTPQQIRHWLTWLARAMVEHEQTVFYLEWMQPDWLPKTGQLLQRLGSAFGVVLLVYLILMLIVSPLVSVLVNVNALISENNPRTNLVFGEVVLLRLNASYPSLFFVIYTCLFYGSIFLLLVWPFGRKIDVVEVLRWSWWKARSGVVVGLVVGVVVTLPSAGLIWMMSGRTWDASGVLGYIGVSGLLFGLLNGLTSDDVPSRTRPNQGMRRSLRYALVIGVGVGLVVGVVAGMIYGALSGLIFGLSKGGYACIKHAILRLFLLGYGYAPLRYVRFLDHAKDLLFLRRVGGGYIFVHRMLMEHFAGLEGSSSR